jgi:hypothetical protein
MAATKDPGTQRKMGRESRKLRGWLEADAVRASDHVLAAIARARGDLSSVAKELGVGERTVDRIMAEHPLFAKVAADMREASKSMEQARRAAKGAA